MSSSGGTKAGQVQQQLEAVSGRKLQDELGIPLKLRKETNGADFIDVAGNEWDTMGVPAAYLPDNWDVGKFTRSIDDHLLKSNMTIVIDLAGANSTQVNIIMDYVASKPSNIADAVIFLE